MHAGTSLKTHFTRYYFTDLKLESATFAWDDGLARFHADMYDEE